MKEYLRDSYLEIFKVVFSNSETELGDYLYCVCQAADDQRALEFQRGCFKVNTRSVEAQSLAAPASHDSACKDHKKTVRAAQFVKQPLHLLRHGAKQPQTFRAHHFMSSLSE